MSVRQLTLAFYGEGQTDRRFLTILITRSVSLLLDRRDVEIIAPVPLGIAQPQDLDQAHRILNVAQQARNFDLLLIHADTDSRDWERARRERIEPGFTLVQQAAGEVCRHLVAVLPVQELEAWIISDPLAIHSFLHAPVPLTDLGLPTHAAAVERDANAKETLNNAWQIAQRNRPRRSRTALPDSYERLATLIAMERLQQVPAYQRFAADLAAALQSLGLLTP